MRSLAFALASLACLAPLVGALDLNSELAAACDASGIADHCYPAPMQAWYQRQDADASSRRTPPVSLLSPDGSRVYLAGMGDGTSVQQGMAHLTGGLVMALDTSDGSLVWRQWHYEPGENGTRFDALSLSPDASLVLAGGTTYDADPRLTRANASVVLAAYDAATGERAWKVRAINPGGNDFYFAHATTADATYLLTGGISGPRILTRIDTATGAIGASVNLSEISGFQFLASSLVPTPAGLIVSGTWPNGYDSLHWPNHEWVTALFDPATGTFAWTAIYAGGGGMSDYPTEFALSPDASTLYVGGYTNYPPIYRARSVVIAYDLATGAEGWRAFPNVVDFNAPRGMVVSPATGDVFLVAQYPAAQGSIGQLRGFMVYGLDAATGATRWSARNLTDELLEPRDIAIHPSGREVYVSGERMTSTQPNTPSDGATVTFATDDGARLWTRHSNHWSDLFEQTRAVLPSPDGSRLYFVHFEPEAAPDGHENVRATHYAVTAADLVAPWPARLAPDAQPTDAIQPIPSVHIILYERGWAPE